MPIHVSDLVWYLPGSDGKIGVLAKTNSINNLFTNISGAQNRDGITDYKQLIFLNSSGLTLSAVKAYFKLAMPGGANLAFAPDPLGVVAATARAVDPSTPPTATAYSAATTVGTALALPNIGAAQCIGIWIRRQAAAGAQLLPERNTLTITGTTPA